MSHPEVRISLIRTLPRWPLAAALITATLALVTFQVGASLIDSAAGQLRSARTQVRDLTADVNRRLDFQARIDAALPMLDQQTGQLQPGDRIRARWLEQLGGLRMRLGVDQLRFEIGTGADAGPSPYRTDRLRLQAELPHEELLVSTLHQLQLAGPGQVRVLGCTIERRPSDPASLPVPEAVLLADCRIEALSLPDSSVNADPPR